jgi:hypothetical protein
MSTKYKDDVMMTDQEIAEQAVQLLWKLWQREETLQGGANHHGLKALRNELHRWANGGGPAHFGVVYIDVAKAMLEAARVCVNTYTKD